MYLDFYKMNASIYKVGESSIEKNPTILLIKLNYRTRSFIFIFRFQTKTSRDFIYFFYQKPSIGIYSTSEAYTIV